MQDRSRSFLSKRWRISRARAFASEARIFRLMGGGRFTMPPASHSGCYARRDLVTYFYSHFAARSRLRCSAICAARRTLRHQNKLFAANCFVDSLFENINIPTKPDNLRRQTNQSLRSVSPRNILIVSSTFARRRASELGITCLKRSC